MRAPTRISIRITRTAKNINSNCIGPVRRLTRVRPGFLLVILCFFFFVIVILCRSCRPTGRTMGRIFLDHVGGDRLYACAACDTNLTNRDELISTRFTGATGRAFLFNKVVNLNYRYCVTRYNNVNGRALQNLLIYYSYTTRRLNLINCIHVFIKKKKHRYNPHDDYCDINRYFQIQFF